MSEKIRTKPPKRVPYTIEECNERRNISTQYIGNHAYVLSPGFDDIWIAVCVVETDTKTGTETILDDPRKWLKWFYADWQPMVLGFAEVYGNFYINKELVVGYDWLRRLVIRTYPAPDDVVEVLDAGVSEKWIDRFAHVNKEHVVPAYQATNGARKKRKHGARKKRKHGVVEASSTMDIFNPDDLMHEVSL